MYVGTLAKHVLFKRLKSHREVLVGECGHLLYLLATSAYIYICVYNCQQQNSEIISAIATLLGRGGRQLH